MLDGLAAACARTRRLASTKRPSNPRIHPLVAPVTVGEEEGRERLEIDLLLEAIHRRYGYDFRGYALASLRRRLWHRVYGEGLTTLSGLQERILHEPGCMDRLLRDLSINVTEMFRDPEFYVSLRERVFPLLRTHPFIRVWEAGCSTGEEIY